LFHHGHIHNPAPRTDYYLVARIFCDSDQLTLVNAHTKFPSFETIIPDTASL
jgi:hypothetical protein